MYFKDNTSILETRENLPDNFKLALGIFVLFVIPFFASTLATMIMGIIYGFSLFYNGADLSEIQNINLDNPDSILLIGLFSTIIPIVVIYLISTKIHKRTYKSLGLTGENKFRNYILGSFLGIIFISLIVWISKILGVIEITNNIENISSLKFLLFIVAWAIQGFHEEFLCRSAIMNLIAAKMNVKKAIIINSLLFSALHLLNSNFTILPAINIFLVGIVFSLMFYLTDNIWLSSAFHSFWNMAQGNIFGISVSGTPQSLTSIFLSKMKGNVLLSGGDFGIEGSIVTSIILILTILAFLYIVKRKNLLINTSNEEL